MKKAAEIRNFAIAGHAGSGKTTLAEMLVFKGKGISRRGPVEGTNTISDFTPEEQDRGGSIYATQLNTQWKDYQFFFADTPGYGEFLGEVTASYAAADAALVIIDCVDGPQVGTARAWKYARLAGKPRAAFVNRLDRDRADFAATLEAMRGNHGKNVIIPLYYPVGAEANFSRVVNVLFDKDIPAEIADQVAECRALWMDVIAETDKISSMEASSKREARENIAGSFKSEPLPETIAAERDITAALARVGKFTREDELNCGACGYNTCREFAAALLQNKAEEAMCHTYLRKNFERTSNALIRFIPAAVVIVDEKLNICECIPSMPKGLLPPSSFRSIRSISPSLMWMIFSV